MTSKTILLRKDDTFIRTWDAHQILNEQDEKWIGVGDTLLFGEVEFNVTWTSGVDERPRVFTGTFNKTNKWNISKGMTVTIGRQGIAETSYNYRLGKFLYPTSTATQVYYDD